MTAAPFPGKGRDSSHW